MEKSFKFQLWPGSGYGLCEFTANGTCFEDALYNLVAQLVNNNEASFYVTDDEMAEMVVNGSVFDLGDGEYEGWSYIDATMEGAPYPVYLRTENLKYMEIA